MQYKSTRNSKIRESSARAIAQGISEEGGLFVPESFPDMRNDLNDFAELDYLSRAAQVLKYYLTDYSAEEIEECVQTAYASRKFENDTPAKVVTLENGMNVLELWHGPTCAFKDMALQILPQLLTKALDKCGEGKEAVILVATSGDTGKAALEGFKDIPGTKLLVFYPEKGVSAMQCKQMNTQEGGNVAVCAVSGNFDDCQTQVKKIFTDGAIKQTLLENGFVFSSANSINLGRLLPQIIYYFSAYCDLYHSGKITSLTEKINIVVPTGNFGNILAAYYAMRMGLPVHKLICASNANNVLTDFIATGVYNKERAFHTTISPSMDILVSSNLERLLFHLCDEDSVRLTEWMTALNKNGTYSVDTATGIKIKELFFGGYCSEDATRKTIKALFEKNKYLCDTHTAVAVKVYEDYQKCTGDQRTSLIVSTASPYKFAPAVLSAFTNTNETDEFKIAEELSALSGTSIPKPLLALKEKEVRFANHAEKETIADFVLHTIGVK